MLNLCVPRYSVLPSFPKRECRPPFRLQLRPCLCLLLTLFLVRCFPFLLTPTFRFGCGSQFPLHFSPDPISPGLLP